MRLYDVLRKDDAECITQADLKQMLNGILLSHPGLEFLQETPEFQERQALQTCPVHSLLHPVGLPRFPSTWV